MSNRFDVTNEAQAMVLSINPHQLGDKELGIALKVLTQTPADCSKWFDAAAVLEYQKVIQSQLSDLKALCKSDPFSRRIVMYGPTGACWLSTQLLSDRTGKKFHCIATYRSLDQEHTRIDAALQRLLGNQICGARIEELTLFAGSWHRYIDANSYGGTE